MDAEKMGKLIAELRREKHLTQKELAAQLNITDKAVSKWERGLSCPDIALLMPLAEVLEISVNELLNGERNPVQEISVPVDHMISYAEENVKQKTNHFRDMSSWIFTGIMGITLIVCAICNYAISQGFSWSIYAVSSIIFSWTILFPLIRFPKKGILVSLTAFSILIIPFLKVIHLLAGHQNILTIGISVSVIVICLSWSIYTVFMIFRSRKLLASGISLFMAMLANLFVNIVISRILLTPVIDIWDILSFIIMIISAVILIIQDRHRQK